MFQDRPFVSAISSLKRSHRKRAVPIKKNFTAARDFVHLTAFYWKKKHGFLESPAHISISKFQLVVQSPLPQALSQILAPPTFNFKYNGEISSELFSYQECLTNDWSYFDRYQLLVVLTRNKWRVVVFQDSINYSHFVISNISPVQADFEFMQVASINSKLPLRALRQYLSSIN